MKIACDILSIIFAFTASYYWFKSSKVVAPKDTGVITFVKGLTSRMIPAGKKVIEGDSLVDKETFYANTSALIISYNKQSELSSIAAKFAALTALFQAFA